MRLACLFRHCLIAVACVLWLGFEIGCQPERALTDQEIFEENVDSMATGRAPQAELSQEVLGKIPSRLPFLKPGMTPGQVYATLHLPDGLRWVEGSGPAERYTLGYQLRTNRFMTLQFNMLTRPPGLLKAEIHGDGWPSSKQ